MGDSIDDDSPERSGGQRAWVVMLVTAVILAALGAGGFAIDRWVIGSDESAVDTVPTTEEDTIEVEPVSSSPTRLFVRETTAGIEIRVNESEMDMFGMPAIDGDDRPAWCRTTTTVMASALSAEAIGQVQLPRTEGPSPDPAVMMSAGGVIEESPLVVVLGQVDDDITQARLSHPSGETDSMAPTDGLIVLAIEVPMPEQGDAGNGPEQFNGPFGVDTSGVAVEFLHADGTSKRLTEQQLWNGLPLWNDPECNGGFGGETFPEPEIPVLNLPKPGSEQPADPTVERAAIERTLTELYDDFGDRSTLFRLVDDPSGLDLLMVGLFREHGEAYRAMDAVISDLVFFSPVEASFVYTTGLDPWKDGFTGRFPAFGRARLIDGTWRITRTTVCQDISKIMQCTI